LTTYVIALSCATLMMILSLSFHSQHVSIVPCIYNIVVAGSYHFAGRRVVRDLNVSQVNLTARLIDIAQIAENIRVTSQAMTRLTLGMSASCIGAALTFPSPRSLYDTQNSLPRIFQAQIFFFVVQICMFGVNNLIVEYLRYGSSKRHLKPESSFDIVGALRWSFLSTSRATHLHLSRAAVVPCVLSAGGTEGRERGYVNENAGSDANDSSNHSNVSSISDLASNSGGVSSLTSEEERIVWSQLRFNLSGRGAQILDSKQDHPAGSQRTGSSGGSRGMRNGEGGMGDIADTERALEINSSGTEDRCGDEKLTEDGPMGSLGAIAEERPEEI